MKGRGRGRPKKILISQTITKPSLKEPATKFKQSEFGLITPETKLSSAQT